MKIPGLRFFKFLNIGKLFLNGTEVVATAAEINAAAAAVESTYSDFDTKVGTADIVEGESAVVFDQEFSGTDYQVILTPSVAFVAGDGEDSEDKILPIEVKDKAVGGFSLLIDGEDGPEDVDCSVDYIAIEETIA